MKINRNDIFVKLDKSIKSIEDHKNSPLVFLMNKKSSLHVIEPDTYIGILDCVIDNQIYLKEAYEINDDLLEYAGDDFKKLDLTREDPDRKDFDNIPLDYIDSVYVSKLNLSLEQVCDAWSEPRDLLITENPLYQKIQQGFIENKIGFDENSPPVYFDENGDQIPLGKIHEIESVNGNPISLIAVTRQQYDITNFPKFEKYIQNNFPEKRIYYGLWPNSETKQIEYDVLYAIPTNNFEKVQNHLNLHDDLNKGATQKMALIVFLDGKFEIIENLL